MNNREFQTPRDRLDPDMLSRLLEMEEQGMNNQRRERIQNNTRRQSTRSSPQVRQNNTTTTDNARRCNQVTPGPLSLAMVYSPKQCFTDIYDADEALSRGTLFAQLYLPFCQSSCRNMIGR